MINLKSNLYEINGRDHSNVSFRSCYESWQIDCGSQSNYTILQSVSLQLRLPYPHAQKYFRVEMEGGRKHSLVKSLHFVFRISFNAKWKKIKNYFQLICWAQCSLSCFIACTNSSQTHPLSFMFQKFDLRNPECLSQWPETKPS